jgi:hypothetical protein
MPYNKDQWIESFEGRLQILRPHLTGRVLGSISNTAWHSHGARGEDPTRLRMPPQPTLTHGRRRERSGSPGANQQPDHREPADAACLIQSCACPECGCRSCASGLPISIDGLLGRVCRNCRPADPRAPLPHSLPHVRNASSLARSMARPHEGPTAVPSALPLRPAQHGKDLSQRAHSERRPEPIRR